MAVFETASAAAVLASEAAITTETSVAEIKIVGGAARAAVRAAVLVIAEKASPLTSSLACKILISFSACFRLVSDFFRSAVTISLIVIP